MFVLSEEAVVEDFAIATELADARVDQRTIFHLLIGFAEDWIDRQQWAVDPLATLIHKGLRELQELADGWLVVVHHAVRPERVVVNVPCGEQIGDSLKVR